MEFKDRLRQLREGANITQKVCAEELKVKYANYNKWENGKTPDFETICRIADYFNVSVDYLIGASNAKKPENETLMSDLGLSEDAIKNIKTNISAGREVNRFLSAPAFRALMVYITAYWQLDNVEFMNDPENSLGLFFHESLSRHTREIIIKNEINEAMAMILDD